MKSPFFNGNNGERPSWTLTIPSHIFSRLHSHLFPGDGDEHGAVIKASVKNGRSSLQLFAREVIVARDGVDFVPGTRGYRMLTGEFVTRQIVRSRDEKSVYLAIHNHGGTDSVGFSRDDLASQERGYPALLDIADGQPVGALVFAKNAVAGRLWLSPDKQIDLLSAKVVGTTVKTLFPSPPLYQGVCDENYDRQARIFGDLGQYLLSNLRVGVIGAGGVGSLLIEYLARLGVGEIVVADPDRVEITNLPRMTGSTLWDAKAFLTRAGRPDWMRKLGWRLSTPKVKLMKRIVRRANRKTSVIAIAGDIAEDKIAREFVDCDYLFLAADSFQARLVFNSIVHGYLIPGVDLGVKVPVEKETGEVGAIRSVVHPVIPSSGCLLCNGFIPPSRLQQEMETPEERKNQRYIDDENVTAPSVITLNAIAASHAVNDFLFTFTGLFEEEGRSYLRYLPRKRRMQYEAPRKDDSCPHCSASSHSLFGLADRAELPTKEVM